MTIVGYILTDFGEVWWDIYYQVLVVYRPTGKMNVVCLSGENGRYISY